MSQATKNIALWSLLVLISSLLIAKFIWPLFLFDVPMGYDPGVYRYLFLQHAKGLPPLFVTELAPWAKEHSLGLFIVTSPLIKIGLPVDWLIGWIWNVWTIVLAGVLAYAAQYRFGKVVGVTTLVAVLLSQAYFDGFSGMYWKAYMALFWWVWFLHLIDRKSWWACIPGILVPITHQQTGLLFVLCVVSGWIVWGMRGWRTRQWQRCTAIGALGAAVCLVVYLPILPKVLEQLPRLLGLVAASGYGGAFPHTSFFLKTTPILLVLGIGGCVWYLWKTRKLDQWSLPVLWSALFVFGKLYFHDRFFLQLDFFLLPFAGCCIAQLWIQFPQLLARIGIVILVIVQLGLSLRPMLFERGPLIRLENLERIQRAAPLVPDNAFVLVPDNHMPFWVRGWFDNKAVGGPGLLHLNWGKKAWTAFTFGTNEDRNILFNKLSQPTYVYFTDYFFARYKEDATKVQQDPCLEVTSHKRLYRVTCQE